MDLWSVSYISPVFRLFGIGFQYMAAGTTIEGFCLDFINIIYIRNQYIFVALTGCYWEFSFPVRVDFVSLFHCVHNGFSLAVILSLY